MTYVCLALIAALVVTVVALAGLIRSQQRAATRERDLLLNQLMHLAGRSWQPAPADTWTPQPAPDDEDGVWPTWSAAPEQQPVY